MLVRWFNVSADYFFLDGAFEQVFGSHSVNYFDGKLVLLFMPEILYEREGRRFSRVWRRGKLYREVDLKLLAYRRRFQFVKESDHIKIKHKANVVASFIAVPQEEPPRKIDERVSVFAALRAPGELKVNPMKLPEPKI